MKKANNIRYILSQEEIEEAVVKAIKEISGLNVKEDDIKFEGMITDDGEILNLSAVFHIYEEETIRKNEDNT